MAQPTQWHRCAMRTREATVDELIVLAAIMIGCGAAEGDVRKMIARETEDDGLIFLILTAGRLLAQSET
jgi:hypothetical protein